MSTRKKKAEIETEIEREPIMEVPSMVDKAKLKELYDARPIFNGREYRELHKWFEQLRGLIE